MSRVKPKQGNMHFIRMQSPSNTTEARQGRPRNRNRNEEEEHKSTKGQARFGQWCKRSCEIDPKAPRERPADGSSLPAEERKSPFWKQGYNRRHILHAVWFGGVAFRALLVEHNSRLGSRGRITTLRPLRSMSPCHAPTVTPRRRDACSN